MSEPRAADAQLHSVFRKTAKQRDPLNYLGFSLPTDFIQTFDHTATGLPVDRPDHHGSTANTSQRLCFYDADLDNSKRMTASYDGVNAGNVANTAHGLYSWRMGEKLIRKHFGSEERASLEHLRCIIERQKRKSYDESNSPTDAVPLSSPRNRLEQVVPHEAEANFQPILRKITEDAVPPCYPGFSLPTHSVSKRGFSAGNAPRLNTMRLHGSSVPPSYKRYLDTSCVGPAKRLTALCVGANAADHKDFAKTIYSPSSWRLGQELIRKHFSFKKQTTHSDDSNTLAPTSLSQPTIVPVHSPSSPSPISSGVRHSSEITHIHSNCTTTTHPARAFVRETTNSVEQNMKKASLHSSVRPHEKQGLLKIKATATISEDPHSMCSRRRGVSRADLQALVRRQREARKAERRRQEQEKLERLERIRRNLQATAAAASQAAKMPTTTEIAKLKRIPLRPARSANISASSDTLTRDQLLQCAYSEERKRILDELLQSEEEEATLCLGRCENAIQSKSAHVASAISKSTSESSRTILTTTEPARAPPMSVPSGRKPQGSSARVKFGDFSFPNDRTVPISGLHTVRPLDIPAVFSHEGDSKASKQRHSHPSIPSSSLATRWLSSDAGVSDDDDDDRTDRSFYPLRNANKLIVLDVGEPSESELGSAHGENGPSWVHLESASDTELADTNDRDDNFIDDFLPEEADDWASIFRPISKPAIFSHPMSQTADLPKNVDGASDVKRLIYNDSMRFSAIQKRCRRDFTRPLEPTTNVNKPKDRWAIPSSKQPAVTTKSLVSSAVNTDALDRFNSASSISDRSRHGSAHSTTSSVPVRAVNDTLSSDTSAAHRFFGQHNFILNAAEQAISSTPCREVIEPRDFRGRIPSNIASNNPPRLTASALGLQLSAEMNHLEALTGSIHHLSDIESLRQLAVAQSETAGYTQLLKNASAHQMSDVGVATKPQLHSVGVSVDSQDSCHTRFTQFGDVLEIGDKLDKYSQPHHNIHPRRKVDIGVTTKPQLQSVGVNVDFRDARSSASRSGVSNDSHRIEPNLRDSPPLFAYSSSRLAPSGCESYTGINGTGYAKGDVHSQPNTASLAMPLVHREDATSNSVASVATISGREYSNSAVPCGQSKPESTVTGTKSEFTSGQSHKAEHVLDATTPREEPEQRVSTSKSHDSVGSVKSVSEIHVFPEAEDSSHSDSISTAFEVDTASELTISHSASAVSEESSTKGESVASDHVSDEQDTTLIEKTYSGYSEAHGSLPEGHSKTPNTEQLDYGPQPSGEYTRIADTTGAECPKQSPCNDIPSGNRSLTPNTQAMIDVKKILSERALSLKSRRERAKKLLALSKSLELEENEVVQLERKALQAAQAKRAQSRSNRSSPSAQYPVEVMRKDILLSQSERYISDFSEFPSTDRSSFRRSGVSPSSSSDHPIHIVDKTSPSATICEANSPCQAPSDSGSPSARIQDSHVVALISPTPATYSSHLDPVSTCTDAGISVPSASEDNNSTAINSAASASLVGTELEDELAVSESHSKASDFHQRPDEQLDRENLHLDSNNKNAGSFVSDSTLNALLPMTPTYLEETSVNKNTDDELGETSEKEFGSSDSLESASVKLTELQCVSEHSTGPTEATSPEFLPVSARHVAVVNGFTTELNELRSCRAAELYCIPSTEQLCENLATKSLVRSPTVRVGSVSSVENVHSVPVVNQLDECAKTTDGKLTLPNLEQQKALSSQEIVDDVTATLFSQILSDAIASAISLNRNSLKTELKHLPDDPITINVNDSSRASAADVSYGHIHPASAVAFPLDEEFLVDNDDTSSDTISIGSLLTAEHIRGLVADIPSCTTDLIHEAVEHLWRAWSETNEKSRQSSLASAVCHPPESFSSTIINESDLDLTLHSISDLRFISRRLIFDLIAEFVQQVYAYDTESFHQHTGSVKLTKPRITSAQFRLWGGSNRPETFDALLVLVKNHLQQHLGLRSCYPNHQKSQEHADASMGLMTKVHLNNLSRLTQWSLSKKSEFDRLLELELRDEESSWLAYGPIEKRLKNVLANEIWDDVLQEAVSSMLDIARRPAPVPVVGSV